LGIGFGTSIGNSSTSNGTPFFNNNSNGTPFFNNNSNGTPCMQRFQLTSVQEEEARGIFFF
jgi:hypothetical protein